MLINILIWGCFLYLWIVLVFAIVDYFLLRLIKRDFDNLRLSFLSPLDTTLCILKLWVRYQLMERKLIRHFIIIGLVCIVPLFLSSVFLINLGFVTFFLVYSTFFYLNKVLLYRLDSEIAKDKRIEKMLIGNIL